MPGNGTLILTLVDTFGRVLYFIEVRLPDGMGGGVTHNRNS